MDHVDSSVPGDSQSGLSVTTGCQDPQDPIGTLTYIWDAPGAELATWPMAIFAV